MSEYSFVLIVVALITVAVIWAKLNAGREAQEKLIKAEQRLAEERSLVSKLSIENTEIKHELTRNLQMIESKEELFRIWENDLSDKAPKIAQLVADYETIYMAISAKFLERKKRPAIKEAKRIREIRKESRNIFAKQRITQYQIQALIDIFPELEAYLDDFSSIESLSYLGSATDIQDQHDRVRDYISSSEYKALSVSDRNQLALDNYVTRTNKSNWQIGRDYEMSIGHSYTTEGWDVEYTGILDGLNDLGRDLICQKNGQTKIIQCKYWAAHKEIHEKHIFQLYGTTVLFNLNKKDLFDQPAKAVFVTNIKLSDKAMKFAKALHIEVHEERSLESYPRIKCNIGRSADNKDIKIYHLPMDQHYDRTQIRDNKCFFAWTVKEAEDEGFRRSYRWSGATT